MTGGDFREQNPVTLALPDQENLARSCRPAGLINHVQIYARGRVRTAIVLAVPGLAPGNTRVLPHQFSRNRENTDAGARRAIVKLQRVPDGLGGPEGIRENHNIT